MSGSREVPHDKLLPQALDMEEALLGALLIDPDQVPTILSVLRPEDFYREAHRLIYEAMIALAARHDPIDVLTLPEYLDRSGRLEEIGGVSAVTRLANEVPHSGNALTYAERIVDAAVLRRIIQAAGHIAQLAYDRLDPEDVIEQATTLLQAAQRVDDGLLGISTADLLDAFEDDLLDRYTAVSEGQPFSISTGLPALDRILVGLEPGDLIYLVGRPGSGKSALARTLAVQVAMSLAARAQRLGPSGGAAQTVDYVSLEMSNLQQIRRMIGAHGHINTKWLRSGFADLPEDERRTGMRHAADLAEYYRVTLGQTLHWEERSVSIRQLRAYVQRAVTRRGLRVLFIDQLDLISDEETGRRQQEETARVQKFSRSLKQMAKHFGISIVCLAQLNREVEKQADKRPALWHIKQSGQMEQDADAVLALYRDALYDKERAARDERYARFCELLVLKAREGDVNMLVPLDFEARYSRFNPWPSDWMMPYHTEGHGAAATDERNDQTEQTGAE